MPCNQTGFTNASLAAKFGIVDFDWSNAKGAWANQSPMDCEERLVTQAAMVKKINPDSHVFVYRNLVKALVLPNPPIHRPPAAALTEPVVANVAVVQHGPGEDSGPRIFGFLP